jgi:hypothetical protein
MLADDAGGLTVTLVSWAATGGAQAAGGRLLRMLAKFNGAVGLF